MNEFTPHIERQINNKINQLLSQNLKQLIKHLKILNYLSKNYLKISR
jgi:hypothetical protein